MHELSIAQSLIDLACETAAREGADRVSKLLVRIGALSGVVKEALLFSFNLAADGTACQGAELAIEEVGVTVECPACHETKTLRDLCYWCCPDCGAPTPKIISGQELDLVAVEIDTHASADSASS